MTIAILCGVLNQASGNACAFFPAPWSCAGHNSFNEAVFVVKSGSDRGGVLCCREEADDDADDNGDDDADQMAASQFRGPSPGMQFFRSN